MEVNNNTSLLSQLTAQVLGDKRPDGPPPPDKQLSLFNPRGEDRGDLGSAKPRSEAVVRVRGGRSAEELGLSDEADLDAARATISRLTDREAPLGRQSSQRQADIPLGQIIDIRV